MVIHKELWGYKLKLQEFVGFDIFMGLPASAFWNFAILFCYIIFQLHAVLSFSIPSFLGTICWIVSLSDSLSLMAHQIYIQDFLSFVLILLSLIISYNARFCGYCFGFTTAP